MVNVSAPFLRIVWFIITSMQLGALLQVIRLDSWHWGVWRQEVPKRHFMEFTKQYYRDIGNGDAQNVYEVLLYVSIAVQTLICFIMFASHFFKESRNHTHGSVSRIADMIQLAVCCLGAVDYKLKADPVLEFFYKEKPKFATPLDEKNMLQQLAETHYRLVAYTTFAIMLALLTLKPALSPYAPVSERKASVKSLQVDTKAAPAEETMLNGKNSPKKKKSPKKNSPRKRKGGKKNN